MTVFSTLNETTQLGVDKIATSPVALALYRNLIAAFEGDATAVAAGIQLMTAAIGNLQVTEGKIGALAVTEGKIGASAVSEGKLASSAVAQAKLKSTTASGSLALGAGGSNSYSLTGGTYSWWTAGGAAAGVAAILWGNGDTGAGAIGIHNLDASTWSFFVDERYIQASPPYNLGHGDIPLFVFALVAADGSLRGVSVAPDPTWAYHGPTNIAPEFYDAQGKPFRCYREVAGVPLAQALKQKATLQKILGGELEVQTVTREITQALKNADMNLYPHPWVGNDLSGLTPVMLDPLSPLVDRLALIASDSGAREARRIVEGGYLRIDNIPLAMTCPAGLMPVAVQWK